MNDVDDMLSTDDWTEVETMLAGHLTRLEEHGFVTIDPPQPVTGPDQQDEPRRGLLGRLRRSKVVVRDRPLVQVMRDREYLEAECSGPVGDAAADYGYPWDEDQQRRLLELGWQPPDDKLDPWHMYRWYGPTPEFPADARAASAQQAARLVVVTLRDVHAMRSPAGTRVIVDRSPG